MPPRITSAAIPNHPENKMCFTRDEAEAFLRCMATQKYLEKDLVEQDQEPQMWDSDAGKIFIIAGSVFMGFAIRSAIQK